LVILFKGVASLDKKPFWLGDKCEEFARRDKLKVHQIGVRDSSKTNGILTFILTIKRIQNTKGGEKLASHKALTFKYVAHLVS